MLQLTKCSIDFDDNDGNRFFKNGVKNSILYDSNESIIFYDKKMSHILIKEIL